LACRRGAGEAQVIGLLDECVADRGAAAEHDPPEARGQSGLFREFVQPQSRQRRLVVRLLHHRVAGDECGEHVHRGQRQRIVPRGDHRDDTLGVTQFARLGEERDHPGYPLRAKDADAVFAVVAGDERGRTTVPIVTNPTTATAIRLA
jgi:hypothetical protein